MTLIKNFLDRIGNLILWVDLAVQGFSLVVRTLLFWLVSRIIPRWGASDFEWKLRPPSVPNGVFVGIWFAGLTTLFFSTSVYVLAAVLVLDYGITLYALLNGKGERRREIFFQTAIQNGLALIFLFYFIIGTGIQHWHKIDSFQHYQSWEGYALVVFLVLKTGLFPFHTNRIDYASEISVGMGIVSMIFNGWILFQVALFAKSGGFLDAFGDWSEAIMAWMMISFLYAIGLSAVQIRSAKIWAHLFWIVLHLSLYLALL